MAQRSARRAGRSWCRTGWPGSSPGCRQSASRSCSARRAAPVGAKRSASCSGRGAGHEVEGVEHAAIGRIARLRNRDAGAGIEQARKASTKPADEPVVTTIRLGRDRDPVGLGVVAGDALAQGRQARAPRCSRCAGRQGGLCGRDHGARGAAPRAGRPPCARRPRRAPRGRRRPTSRPWRGTGRRAPRARRRRFGERIGGWLIDLRHSRCAPPGPNLPFGD